MGLKLALNEVSCGSAWGQARMAPEREALDGRGEGKQPKESQMSAAIAARGDQAQHREGAGPLRRSRDMLLAIAVPLPSPISARAHSRPKRRRAAATASEAERFGHAAEISTILICYDGSPGARQAVEHAGRLLPGTRAVVLNVWSSPAGMAACGLAGTAPHDFGDWMRSASDVAADGVQRARAAGLDAVALTTNGMVEGIWRSILALAGECGADLIVVGSRGLTGLRAIIAGSVSRSLVEHARRPVLVVPDECANAAAREWNATMSDTGGRRAPTRLQGRRP
jgi:nucleotide-binding universal stress UspA family protein